MDALTAVQEARVLLRDVTPLRRDCGGLCGAACCVPDEDGQGGMLLLTGEEQLYPALPEGFSILPDHSILPNGRLFICDGLCERDDRPLSCRVFPLMFTSSGKARLDRRAWAMCPLMDSGVAGLSREFVAAVQKANEILLSVPEHRAWMEAVERYIEQLTGSVRA